MNLHLDRINKYLWCGYLPPDEFPAWLPDCITAKTIGRVYSPQEAAGRFDALFDVFIDQFPSRRHVIPLSGGLDSRAILGALLERVDSNRVVAVTYGVPGQLDYDLGKIVADSVGVEHHAFDLRTVDFSWDAIRESVAASPWTYVPDGFFNSLCRNLFSSKSDTVWSGFLGETLSGSHLSDRPDDYHEQVTAFSLKQKRGKTHPLCVAGFSFTDVLPFPEQNMPVAYGDFLDLGIRQAHATASIVLPIQRWEHWGALIGEEKNGAQVIAPFADPAWAGYWLSAPREVRKGQKLYLEMLNLKFPELYSLPGKVNYGTKLYHGLRPCLRRGVTTSVHRCRYKHRG